MRVSGCRGGFNRIVGEAGCSAWNAYYQIGKSETSRSHLITRWVGWRFGIVHMMDLRKGLSSSDLAGRNHVCVTRNMHLNRLDMKGFGEGKKVC